MNLVSLENVSKNFGFRPLFENVTLGLEEGDKIGIIGANGSGKTTLLRIIAGVEVPDTGRVTRAKGKSLAYLSQNPPYDENLTVLETIFASSSGVMQTIRDYEDVCHEVAAGNHEAATLQRMSDLQHELEMNGGWEIETNARAVLTKLDITDTHVKMGTLSGGQRKRVALAHELIFKPDILILDEPTNHLDADTIEWLEDYLSRYTGVLLLVTHDRYFLDRVTDRILEIDRGAVQSFSGNYAYYLEKKAEQDELRAEDVGDAEEGDADSNGLDSVRGENEDHQRVCPEDDEVVTKENARPTKGDHERSDARHHSVCHAGHGEDLRGSHGRLPGGPEEPGDEDRGGRDEDGKEG